MIKFENTEVYGWEAAIRGMRMPMQSWAKSDTKLIDPNESYIHYEHTQDDNTLYGHIVVDEDYDPYAKSYLHIGPNDFDLMTRLRNAGTDHRKFMRMITVTVDITAPMYWWKEFDTYKVGTVRNSTSTMHKIHAKEFTLEDFSCEHLVDREDTYIYSGTCEEFIGPKETLEVIIDMLNESRREYLETKDKKYWWQMIQLLPSSYNQKSTVLLNYEVLANMYHSRRGHKLDEWSVGFVKWVKSLPYSELITGEDISKIPICHEIMNEAERRIKNEGEED